MGKIDTRNGKMDFFDNIAVDTSLAKYKSMDKSDPASSDGMISSMFVTSEGLSINGTNEFFRPSREGGNISWVSSVPVADRAGETILSKLKALFKRRKKQAHQVFLLFSGNASVMEKMRAKKEKIETAIKTANDNHQTALAEKIASEMREKIIEDRLIEGGFRRCITEGQAVKFFDKCDCTPLSLTYLKNYIRPLPGHAVEKIRLAEEMRIFDNYVILHFDPLGEGERLTAKEEAQRHDPILFGVIREHRKFYFVADWIDEVCSLTLEALIDKLEMAPTETEMKEYIP